MFAYFIERLGEFSAKHVDLLIFTKMERLFFEAISNDLDAMGFQFKLLDFSILKMLKTLSIFPFLFPNFHSLVFNILDLLG